MKEIIIKDLTKDNSMNNFIEKLKKLNDENLIKELEELYKKDPEQAKKQYRMHFAKKAIKDKNNLFKRLSDM